MAAAIGSRIPAGASFAPFLRAARLAAGTLRFGLVVIVPSYVSAKSQPGRLPTSEGSGPSGFSLTPSVPTQATPIAPPSAETMGDPDIPPINWPDRSVSQSGP